MYEEIHEKSGKDYSMVDKSELNDSTYDLFLRILMK